MGSGNNTLYHSHALVVDPPGHRARAAAVANLLDVVQAQIRYADANQRWSPRDVVDVIIAADAMLSVPVVRSSGVGDNGWGPWGGH